MTKKIRFALLIGSLLIAAFSGFRMVSLNEQQELWGRLPLFFYISVWLSIVFALGNHYSTYAKNWRWLGLSSLSGVILSLGFPPLPLAFLMFIGFVPLLIVEREISNDRETPSKKLLLRYAYNTFVIWNILTTWWVGNTAFVAGIVAIWLNALFMCVPILLFHHTKKKIPKTGYLGFVVFWLCFEYLHLNWEISWVWLSLGNAFASMPSWVQWYEYTGVFGGSLWILYANFLAFSALQKIKTENRKARIQDFIKVAALVLLPITISILIKANYTLVEPTTEVLIGQPNYEPHYEKFNIPKAVRDQQLVDLAMQNIRSETEFFVLPETVFNNVDEDRPEQNSTVRLFQPVLNAYPNVKIISGVSAHKFLNKNEADTPATRTRYKPDGSIKMRYESLNAAIQLQKDQDIQFYRKSKFVPGAELLPYKKIFFWLKPLIDKLDGSMEGLGTQAERSTFNSKNSENSSLENKVAPVICYESVFGEYHTGYLRKGANLIAIMTNDGWWDNTAGHKQHLAFARLRAIETRRWIARSANTGISAFINPLGEITAQTQYDERTTLRGKVHLNEENTIYSRWQDLIARIALFTALLLLINTIAKGRLPQRK